MNVIASSGNFRRPILIFRHHDTVVHRGTALHYQQIGAFRSVVYAVEYAVDALFIHRFEPPPSWTMRYRIKRRSRDISHIDMHTSGLNMLFTVGYRQHILQLNISVAASFLDF